VQITGKVVDEFLLKFFEGRNVSPGQTNFSADLDAELKGPGRESANQH